MPSFGGITRPSAITPPFDNNNDVILFGSGYDNYTSPGNEFFRTLCSEERSSVPKKRLRPSEKVDMINKIMTAVKSKGGRFVEENGSEWIEVTDEIARKLISRRLKPSKLSPPPTKFCCHHDFKTQTTQSVLGSSSSSATVRHHGDKTHNQRCEHC